MNGDRDHEKGNFIAPGDPVYHVEYGDGVVIQVQPLMLLVNWKSLNQLKLVKKSEVCPLR
ncbi:hypothetical protein ABE38_24785 [Brevibacillus agri]|nr:hypothetical protein [Brevibacillus agri]